ncbi:MAG: hypothetical protein A2Z11_01485 [Candidatus Woykebacteria bacterium RBG_16_43_9]|uniref:Uncharacterized protein n=1 Tax=Candidatus Woykebacteria bacterium RBG_16_43_9 TaxID=1802596 RepID=A0A1G1WGK4_9BACT|nr:MAG: hypothetical protein A2Z11_01485 [Candidatus Woykebacteria bacterium RBG_16_43_9]
MKKLTVQEYIDLSQTSISDFFTDFVPILTNIVAALVAVALGVVIGWILKRIVEEISRAVSLERFLSGLPFYSNLTKSHDKTDVTTLVGEVVRWIAIIVFLIPAVASIQIGGSDVAFSAVFGYISNVIVASLYLLFGFVVAWFIHRVITAVGVTVGNNPAHLIANIAYLAIVVYAALQALGQLGIGADMIRLGIIAALAAGALGFGLAAKESAADLIKRFMDRTK